MLAKNKKICYTVKNTKIKGGITMKYCNKCGKEIMDEAVICPHCGCSQQPNTPQVVDSSSFGWSLLGFCIPIVGLILFLVWKDTTPLKAKSAGMGALVSVIVGVVFYIIYAIIIGVTIGSSL